MDKIKIKNNFNLGNFIIAVLLPLTVGFIAGRLNSQSMEVYTSFERPFFFPPAWVFPVVWTILYIFMGIASYLVLNNSSSKEEGRSALTFYLIQLVLNFAWTFIFFTYKLYGLAFLELILLLIFVIITTVKFFKINKISGLLMIPYIIWLLYAGVLNFYVWKTYEMTL